MNRPPGLDPEVLADLRLRESSERDPTRTRGATISLPSPVVEHWPCRGGCGTMVGITREGIDAFAATNRRLRSMRQEPIEKQKVMWCPDCKRRDDELAQLERDAKRRPHEQQPMPLDEPPEHASGMRTQPPRRRKP